MLYPKSRLRNDPLADDILLLRSSQLVDPIWYREAYADLRDVPIDAARHYLEYGAAEGRNPGPDFDTNFYLEQNPDVLAAGMNPLVHFLRHGESEGRLPLPERVNPVRDVPAKALDVSSMTASLLSPIGDRPVLSVVIPTYNRASNLRDTLANLTSLPPNEAVEFIVVDDGSTDGTPDVIEYAKKHHSNIRGIRLENGGAGRARNFGAEVARSDLLLFLGDDTRALDNRLFIQHIQAHMANPEASRAVLGKVVWPDQKNFDTNFVMQLIQGDGQQQFGFKFMQPGAIYSWPFFYTSNVSMKRNCVENWQEDGFSDAFYAYGFEDGEFAYRLTQRYPEFGIMYVPTAVVTHHHHYTVEGFLNRQTNCGLMADVFIKLHPKVASLLVGDGLLEALKVPLAASDMTRLETYIAAIEGVKAWALILEGQYAVGSQNWHAAFLNAVFRLCYSSGYLLTQGNSSLNLHSGYQYILEQFRSDLKGALATEIFGLEVALT